MIGIRKIGIGLNLPKGGFSAEYQAVYNSLTTKPSAVVAAAQNTMVAAMVSAGVWAKLDLFYLFAQSTNGASEALKNWLNPGTYDGTNVHSTAFVALEGFTGDGANDHINTNWNPNTHGINYTKDNASAGIYIRNDIQENTQCFGIYDGAEMVWLGASRVGNDYRFIINDRTNETGTNTDSRGFHIIQRTASNARAGYKNKVLITSDTQASTAVPNADMFVLARNNEGVAGNLCNYQASCFFAGASFSEAERNSFTDALEAYMDSNSKGVIP